MCEGEREGRVCVREEGEERVCVKGRGRKSVCERGGGGKGVCEERGEGRACVCLLCPTLLLMQTHLYSKISQERLTLHHPSFRLATILTSQ